MDADTGGGSHAQQCCPVVCLGRVPLNTVAFLSPVQAPLQLVEARLHAQADERHPDLRAALEQILAAGGKRIRPTLGLLIGDMLGVPQDRLVTLGAAVELLHTATLVHDDLIDGSLLRRHTHAERTLVARGYRSHR